MGKPMRKPHPAMPAWFWRNQDGCWACKNKNNCSQCKAARMTSKKYIPKKAKGRHGLSM